MSQHHTGWLKLRAKVERNCVCESTKIGTNEKICSCNCRCFFAKTAFAETITYNCKMTKRYSYGWVADEYAFRVDMNNKSAMAASTHHDWMETRFRDRGAKGYRMSWNVSQLATGAGNIRARYQANLNPKDNSVSVRVAFVTIDAANSPYGVGKCSVAE